MPGFDGRGPKGLGPMTGRGGGFCVLEIPSTPNEPMTGFAGLAGWPASGYGSSPEADLDFPGSPAGSEKNNLEGTSLAGTSGRPGRKQRSPSGRRRTRIKPSEK